MMLFESLFGLLLEKGIQGAVKKHTGRWAVLLLDGVGVRCGWGSGDGGGCCQGEL